MARETDRQRGLRHGIENLEDINRQWAPKGRSVAVNSVLLACLLKVTLSADKMIASADTSKVKAKGILTFGAGEVEAMLDAMNELKKVEATDE